VSEDLNSPVRRRGARAGGAGRGGGRLEAEGGGDGVEVLAAKLRAVVIDGCYGRLPRRRRGRRPGEARGGPQRVRGAEVGGEGEGRDGRRAAHEDDVSRRRRQAHAPPRRAWPVPHVILG
jgi:hypothetical protein